MVVLSYILTIASKVLVVTNLKVAGYFLLNYGATALAAAFSGIRYRVSPLAFALFGIACVFAMSGQLKQAASCLLLPFVATAYAHFVSSTFIQRHALKFQLLLLAAIVILSLDVFLSLNFVSAYGRRQLLFGVDHPKEQALLILFIFFTFWSPIQRGKLQVLVAALVLCLLFLTDARASFLGFVVFLLSYVFGFRNVLSLGVLLVSVFILGLALGAFDTDAANRFSSNRLMLWFELFANGRNIVASRSIDSSWLELGRNGTVLILLIVPFFMVVLGALLDFSKDNSIYSRTVCAMGLHYLSAFTFDIGAFSSTNFMAVMFWGYFLNRHLFVR